MNERTCETDATKEKPQKTKRDCIDDLHPTAAAYRSFVDTNNINNNIIIIGVFCLSGAGSRR